MGSSLTHFSKSLTLGAFCCQLKNFYFRMVLFVEKIKRQLENKLIKKTGNNDND